MSASSHDREFVGWPKEISTIVGARRVLMTTRA
jgi:hypothetical protein